MSKANWYKLLCKKTEIQLLGTLDGGQSFRWKKKLNNNNQWIGVFSNKVWILEQDENCIRYQVFENKIEEHKNAELYYNSLLKDYFQLDINISENYAEWAKCDKYFKDAAKQFYAIRILKQNVVENIFSFICSSNNHISRISAMVEKLAKFYGEPICEVEGEMYYSFPNVESLASTTVENKLRLNGFGYRSKYISKSAQIIMDQGGDKWITKLKEMEYKDAKKTLMTLTGVGAKVADCICLMSLGHLQAIPVDTHIYQVAKRYMPGLPNNKTVTEKVYNDIGDFFRSLYGPLAGWAHTILFCADLKQFQGSNTDRNESNGPRKKVKSKK